MFGDNAYNNGNVRDDFTLLKGSTLGASATDVTTSEDSADSGAAVTITRTGATDLPLVIDSVIGGTAAAADYTPALSGTLSVGVGKSTKTGLAYRVLGSSDLINWSPSVVTNSIDSLPNPTGPEAHKASVASAGPQRFLTLEISLP